MSENVTSRDRSRSFLMLKPAGSKEIKPCHRPPAKRKRC